MSLQADIQVRYVNAANQGKKLGSIADTGGNRWLVPAPFVDLFSVNDQCSITYERQTWGDNPNLVTAKNGILLADLAAGKHSSPPMKTQPAPPPRTPEHDAQALNIFVTGIVGRAMGSGQFGATDIKALVYAAKEAFEEVIMGQTPAHVSQPTPGVSPNSDGPPPGHPASFDL